MRRRLTAFTIDLMHLLGSMAWTGRIVAWFLRVWGGRFLMHKIGENRTLQAFYHPRPNDSVHILIVPKQAIRSLTTMDESHAQILVDLISIVQDMVDEHGLEQCGFRLIVNGGPYQEISQLHFHLVSGGSED
jgi:histidine triad (HIT) family protein